MLPFANIMPTIDGRFSLNYQSPENIGLSIKNRQFNSIEDIENYLEHTIKRQIVGNIAQYLRHVTLNHTALWIKAERSMAVERLNQASLVLPLYSLQQVCQFILVKNGVVDLMKVLLPSKYLKKTFNTANNFIQDYQNFTQTILLTYKKPQTDDK